MAKRESRKQSRRTHPKRRTLRPRHTQPQKRHEVSSPSQRSTPAAELRVQPNRVAKSKLQNQDQPEVLDNASDVDDRFDADVQDDESAFDNIAKDLEIKGEGLLCELHSYDSRYNSRGERVIMQTGNASDIDFDYVTSSEAALKLTRFYTWEKSLESTQLEIQSPHIKLAMREVIKSYPGVNINTKRTIILKDEPRCLFHYRGELRDYAESSLVPDMYRHVSFCLRYMYRNLRTEVLAFENAMSSSSVARSLEFEHLWMAFKPGDLLHINLEGTEILGNFLDIQKEFRGKDTTKDFHAWSVSWQNIRYNGKRFGLKTETVLIERYSGYKQLRKLAAYPLKYHEDAERVKQSTMQRGKKYTRLRGMHYCVYKGRSKFLARASRSFDPFERSQEQTVQDVHHRVMIDAVEYHTNVERDASVMLSELLPEDIGLDHGPGFTDEEYMICWPHVPGFSFHVKQWGLFDVSGLSDLAFNSDAFEALVLPSEKKDMFRSLIQQRELRKSSFDDLIVGKGKGLIFLLHGPPGVGKTFTAESIAEYSKRPLYAVNCGELGTESYMVESTLTRILLLATRWNAVVLMDEADVFMMERQPDNIQRNGLVAVLLRMLEYFEGILFLTTNKLEVIDSAFKSRIHLSVSYPPLSVDSRRALWRTFATKAASLEEPPSWLNNKFLDKAASFDINGREIKNVARVAHALAVSAERSLVPQDIFDVLEAASRFGLKLQIPETRKAKSLKRKRA